MIVGRVCGCARVEGRDTCRLSDGSSPLSILLVEATDTPRRVLVDIPSSCSTGITDSSFARPLANDPRSLIPPTPSSIPLTSSPALAIKHGAPPSQFIENPSSSPGNATHSSSRNSLFLNCASASSHCLAATSPFFSTRFGVSVCSSGTVASRTRMPALWRAGIAVRRSCRIGTLACRLFNGRRIAAANAVSREGK